MKIFYYFFFSFLFLINLPANCEENYVGANSIETLDQSLFLRRIIDFFEEGETDFVKKEIKKYFENDSSSPFAQYLKALLGDIYMKEKKYSDALSQYEGITDPKIFDVTIINHFQCLYL